MVECASGTGTRPRPPPSVTDHPAPSELTTALAESEGRGVLRVAGEVDLLTAHDFAAALEGAQLSHDQIVVDLREVAFMDSTGLRVLLQGLRRTENTDATLELAITPGSAVERLLLLAGVKDLFPRSEP